MILRPLQYGDSEAIGAIHAAMGIDYKMPELESADFVQIVEHEGRVIGASMNRTVAETYLWIDPALDPRDKWTAIRMGQRGMIEEAHRRGWKEIFAMIPDLMTCKFAKRLILLHWNRQRTGWTMWGREI